ncbi:MAG: nuclear transport factor 2 family protein [Sphingomicrobium sp.]
MKLVALLIVAAVPALASCAVNSAATVAQADPQAVVDGLLATDRAFSAQAAGKPLAAALPAMFDDTVILPLPTGTFATGREAAIAALNANPVNAGASAQWAPVRAGISADGTQGFTYGFMTVRAAGKPDVRAKYLAYWVKRPEGWRVAAYKRAASGPGDVQTQLRAAALPARMIPPNSDARTIDAYRAGLAANEKAFSDQSQIIGIGPAFLEFGAEDAMNMGPGPDFTFGNQTISSGFPPGNKPPPFYWSADAGALVASSGDLGVTWGLIRPHVPRPAGERQGGAFFTIWRRATPQAPWRYIAE